MRMVVVIHHRIPENAREIISEHDHRVHHSQRTKRMARSLAREIGSNCCPLQVKPGEQGRIISRASSKRTKLVPLPGLGGEIVRSFARTPSWRHRPQQDSSLGRIAKPEMPLSFPPFASAGPTIFFR